MMVWSILHMLPMCRITFLRLSFLSLRQRVISCGLAHMTMRFRLECKRSCNWEAWGNAPALRFPLMKGNNIRPLFWVVSLLSVGYKGNKHEVQKLLGGPD